MSQERKTLFELAPERFVVPGQYKNGAAPLPDLVFEKDPSIPGLYRAKIDKADITPADGGDLKITTKGP